MSPEPRSTANPGYALGQLQRAFASATGSTDPAVRRRAAAKADRWRAVLAGMATGELTVGSRTPVRDIPAWVTLEVVHGGFVTGRLLAEQPLDDEEAARLAELPGLPGRSDRERLNLWFLSDDGQAELLAALEQDRCVVDLPEHAALATVALLLARGAVEPALDLVEQLRPLLHRLRCTPRLVREPQPSGALVHLESVGEVRFRLLRTTTPLQVQAMRTTLTVWNVLQDDLLRLWTDTLEGEPPHLVHAEGGTTVAGGWPCRRFPPDWVARRQDLLERYERAVRETTTPTRHLHPRSSTRRLVDALRVCPHDSSALTGRQVGWVRRVLADADAAGGAPASSRRAALRAQQAQTAARPTRRAVAEVLAARLEGQPADGALPDPAFAVAAVRPEELPGLRRPEPVRTSLRRRVLRASEAPVPQLVAEGVIGSGDVLAQVLPQVASQHLASGIPDPVAAGLYARTYAAFRRRRSVLLLDLQHQVRFEELPWVAALDALRRDETPSATVDALREVVLLTLTAFPHAIMPNALVRELSALSRRAGLRVPLVEEVAADIFAGTFTTKWRAAAQVASRTLDGNLYARYYDLPPAASWQDPVAPRRGLRLRLRAAWRRRTAEDFTALCRTRAREAGGPGGRWDTAGNGTVLEQSSILTTQNLAVLVDALGLQPRLAALAPSLAERVLDGVVRSWHRLPRQPHAQLIAVKTTASAWRQAVFLLSACSLDEQLRQVAVLRERAQRSAPALGPVVQGLAEVVHGARPDAAGRTAGGGRRLLGWSVGPHWLLQRQGELRGTGLADVPPRA